jgi:excisionase family DNA binding protein
MSEEFPPKKQAESVFHGTVDEAIARVIRDEMRRLNLRAKRMLTREEAAEHLGCSPSTIDNLVAEGKLTPSYYTRRPMFDVLELDKLIEETRGQTG